MAFGSLRKLALQGFRDTGVKRPSRLAQQRAIRCVLHERMLEQVGRMRRHALPEKQAGGNETVERRSQLLLRLAYDRSQQGIRELAPIAAPICATSLAGPRRSRRAISDACKLAG